MSGELSVRPGDWVEFDHKEVKAGWGQEQGSIAIGAWYRRNTNRLVTINLGGHDFLCIPGKFLVVAVIDDKAVLLDYVEVPVPLKFLKLVE